MRETTELIRKEVETVREDVGKLNSYEMHINDKFVPINFLLHLTLVDGKVINALTGSSSQSCYICKCKPSEMNDLKQRLPIAEVNFQ